MSITAYGLQIRLERAWRLLTTSYLSVKEIGYKIGIPNPSNFTRHFKNRYRMTPEAARENYFDEQKASLTNTNQLQPSRPLSPTSTAVQQET